MTTGNLLGQAAAWRVMFARTSDLVQRFQLARRY
jgi:hypothetical protein